MILLLVFTFYKSRGLVVSNLHIYIVCLKCVTSVTTAPFLPIMLNPTGFILAERTLHNTSRLFSSKEFLYLCNKKDRELGSVLYLFIDITVVGLVVVQEKGKGELIGRRQ